MIDNPPTDAPIAIILVLSLSGRVLIIIQNNKDEKTKITVLRKVNE